MSRIPACPTRTATDPRSPEGIAAYRRLFCAAIFLAYGLSTLPAVARDLHLSRKAAAAMFATITPGQPASFFAWLSSDPSRAEAWVALTANQQEPADGMMEAQPHDA